MATNPNNPEFWSDAKVVDTSNPAYWADAKVVDAPNNTVFDEANNRVLSLPQTLNADEVDYVIKRDVDGQKNLFGGVSIGNGGDLGSFLGRSLRMPTLGDVGTGLPEFVARGAVATASATPQVFASLVQEQARNMMLPTRQPLGIGDNIGNRLFQENLIQPLGLAKYGVDLTVDKVRNNIINAFGGPEKLEADMTGMIERNKKYLEQAGLNRPESGLLGQYLYDLGAAGTSLFVAIGITALTRSPAAATVVFGAMQKSQIYQEAVQAGKSQEFSSGISTLAGGAEILLEYTGINYFMKAFRENVGVKKFIQGALVEGAQEMSQAISEEAITQLSGIREKGLVQTIKDVLWVTAVGAKAGGIGAGTLGNYASDKAKEAGFNEDEASAIAEYAEKNIDLVKQDMAEFIRKEVMPIAQDDATAQEFIKLMQNFDNNVEVANIADLDQDQRAVFDKFVEQFNNATVDKVGVAAVEKAVYDNAVQGGLNQEEAVTASKMIGARADAASRALGVTPEQWWASQNLRFERKQKPDDAALEADAVTLIGDTQDITTPPAAVAVEPVEIQRIKAKFPESEVKMAVDYANGTLQVEEVKAKRDVNDIGPQLRAHFKKMGINTVSLTAQEREAVIAGRRKYGKAAPTLDSFRTDLGRVIADDAKLNRAYARKDGLSEDYVRQHLVERGVLDENDGLDEMRAVMEKVLSGRAVYPKGVAPSNIEAAPDAESVAFEKSIELEELIGESLKGKTPEEVYRLLNERVPELGQDVEQVMQENVDADFLFQQDIYTADTIDIDGITRPTTNSNGQPIAQTEEGLRNFWRWFGDSKVVDADGKPLVVYHGTDAEFNSFDLKKAGSGNDKGMRGKGFYFTPNQKTALGYGKNITPSYLRISNPFVPLNYQSKSDIARDIDIEEGAFVYEPGNRFNVYQSFSGSFTSSLKDKGYDGVVYTEGQEVVAFNPEQIKSVNNVGTFNPADANILNQGEAKAPRGQTVFYRDGRKLIQLFEKANASTIIHELGHVFLRDMKAVSNASIRPRVKKDYEIIKQWLGVRGDNITVSQEEKFARGFELYVREGNAPREELKGIFERFKEWLTAIYRSVTDLKVDINDEVRQVFERMLGGDFKRTEAVIARREKSLLDRDYEVVAGAEPPVDLRGSVNTLGRSLGELTSDIFAPVSTRLGNIDGRLREIVRRFLFDTGVSQVEDKRLLEPFYNRVHKEFSKPDYRILDLALKNRDTEKVNELVAKYGLEVEWAKVRDVLDRIYNEAQEAGLEMNFVEEYFPRMVKRDKVGDFLAMLRGKPYWSEIEAGLNEADPNNTMTDEEKVDWINSFLRGFSSARINIAKPSFTKERTIDYVTPEMNMYYEGSLPTLLKYVSAMRATIEQKRLFGKGEKDKDKSIGAYVRKMVEQGAIDQSREQEVKDLIKAVVDARGTRGFVTWTKNLGYITLMGNPISTLTQVGDLAFAAYKNGYYNAAKGFFKSVTGRQMLTKEDLGIDNVLQEFEDETKSGAAVRKVFKAVGLEFMDNVGKETFIDSTYARLVKQNKKGGAEWDAYLDTLFGAEAAGVKQDLTTGTISENVKYMLFSELSNIQPISLAEMPVAYLNGGNGRVFYMLKSYTIKQIDLYRREIFSKMASGDVKQTAEGVRNLVALSAALMLAGMTSDALKDLLLGREIVLDDLVADNILKLLTISKYQLYKGKEENLAEGFINTLMVGVPTALQDSFSPVPITVVNDVLKDTYRVITREDRDITDSRIPNYVPVVGKFYYWWWGGGRTKEMDEQAKRQRQERRQRIEVRKREE